MLAVFDATAGAIRCATSILEAAAERQGLAIRAGVHVGEVELAGDDVRGVTVHEAARVMAAAGANEMLVSETVGDALQRAAELRFEDAGEHELKGVPEPLAPVPGGGLMEVPEPRYARAADGVSRSLTRCIGHGRHDIVYLPGNATQLDVMWEHPVFADVPACAWASWDG